eukprot:7009116-Pyramimonas_sp.AAC.1
MLTILKTNTYRAVVPLDLEIFVKMRPKCEHSGNSQQCVTHELVCTLCDSSSNAVWDIMSNLASVCFGMGTR